MKVCTVCHIEKPLTEFHRDNTHGDGYRSQCKPCKLAKDRLRTRKPRVEKPRQLDVAALAHKNAILKLIQNHRVEFEALVNAEKMAFRVQPKQVADNPKWRPAEEFFRSEAEAS